MLHGHKGNVQWGVTEEGDETVTVAYAEFSTSRLVAGNHTRLTITRNSDNAQVLNIPLNSICCY